MSENIVISREDLEEKLLRIFDTLNVSREDARLIADTLIQAEQ